MYTLVLQRLGKLALRAFDRGAEALGLLARGLSFGAACLAPAVAPACKDARQGAIHVKHVGRVAQRKQRGPRGARHREELWQPLLEHVKIVLFVSIVALAARTAASWPIVARQARRSATTASSLPST